MLALALTALAASLTTFVIAQQIEETTEEPAQRLCILWTSGDPDVAHRMVLMYAHVAQRQGWWDEIEVIIWGPSQRIFVGDHDLQDKIAEMREDGVEVRACIACANTFGIVEELRGIGLEVAPMGGPLTERLQDPEWTVMTF
jgi:hypothetical protein